MDAMLWFDLQFIIQFVLKLQKAEQFISTVSNNQIFAKGQFNKTHIILQTKAYFDQLKRTSTGVRPTSELTA